MAASLSPLTVRGNEPAPREEFIMNAWSDQSDCNRENARTFSLGAVLADAKSLSDECVIVEGYWYGRALFRTERDARTDRSNTASQLRGGRLGLYARWDLLDDLPKRPIRQIFVGRLGDMRNAMA